MLIAAAGLTAACAGWDNPTALADLEPDVEFDVEADHVETFEEVEFHVHVREGGSPLHLTHGELEIRHATSGMTRLIDLEPEGDAYAAHVTFFEPGEHHVHLIGMPEHHGLSIEMGETEVDVERRHATIGTYRVEVSVSPVPEPAVEAHVHLHVFDASGAPATGLTLHLEMHAPDGSETELAVAEEDPGEYEAAFTFGALGPYELHVEIETAAGPVDGEFHIPLFVDTHDDGDGQDQGGDGHAH